LKKKDIIKSIKSYIEEKNKVNIKGHYAILIFQEEGNPIFITDKKNADIITKAIEENWKTRPKEQSFFENGLFYIFSYIAETVRKKSKFNRVLIITDTPSDLNEEYQDAVFNLVDKIKHFPTFIDIIRVAEKGKRFYKDDVKLNILASETKGGNFLIHDKKEFNAIITKLVKSKQLVTTFVDRPDQIKISQDDYMFYSRLAKQLKPPEMMEASNCYFCGEQICPVCADINDIPLLCEDCGASFHSCCAINYTITHNIGIPHIFRCPRSECDVLLQIDENEIVEVSGEEGVTSVKEYIGMEIYDDDSPQILSVEDFKSMETSEIESYTETKTLPQAPSLPKSDVRALEEPPVERMSKIPGGFEKTVKIGGFFGKMYKVRKDGDKIIYERTAKSYKAEVTTELPSGKKEAWSPTSTKLKKTSSINICPICGTSLKQGIKKCKNCGSAL